MEAMTSNKHSEINKKKSVSIVIPIYNEATTLNELLSRIAKVTESLSSQYEFEFIFVDDGSKDQGLSIAKKLILDYPKLKVVELQRNYGQTAALQAGLDVANGDIIISMDGDLQHFPEEIPRFLEKVEEDFDVVCGWRSDRQEGPIRRWPSKVANYLIRKISGLTINDIGTTYRAYRREVVEDLVLLGENHRFVPVFINAMGGRITEIPIKNIERPHGKSNYGINRTFNVFIDMFFLYFFVRYLDRPIRIFGKIALIMFAIGISIALVLGFIWLKDGVPVVRLHSGWFTLSTILFLTGVQIFLTGVISEILSRIYFSTNRRAAYKIRKIWDKSHQGD